MSRPIKATINLFALRKNLQLIRKLTTAKVIGVIKADAYGHGAIPIARVLEAVSYTHLTLPTSDLV